MVHKIKIVEKLGEAALLLPGKIAAALAANDQLKLKLTALQEAASRALRGGEGAERPADGAAEPVDPRLQRLIAGARRLDAASFVAPGAADLIAGAADDVAAMLAPLEAAETDATPALRARVEAVLRSLPSFAQDRVSHAAVASLAGARRGGDDSLHLLVMDLHKEINRLAAATATEQVDGAHTYGLDDEGRARVRAFMAGLHRTSELTFGHPGLETTAAKSGSRLTIQNDIGTTDAHVLVIHVEGLEAQFTYTDVHRLRAQFFMSMLAGETISWSQMADRLDADLAEGEAFHLLDGRYRAGDLADLDRFLAAFGSRIVFLIDWNKARKTLQTFVPKAAAVALLEDAALRDKGHRAFLELGGVELVYEAVRRDGRIAYGAALEDELGAGELKSFLRSVLTIASDGLKDGRSARLIGDEVQTDLAARLDSAERALMDIVLRHLGLTRTLAGMIVAAIEPGQPAERRKALAERAKRIETKGDRLTVEARSVLARLADTSSLGPLVEQIEGATDTLDEAAFLLSLVLDRGVTASLSPLAGLARDGVASLVRAVEATRRLHEGKRIDTTFALQHIDETIDVEREADTAERAAIAAILSPDAEGEGNLREGARHLVLGLEIARTLEAATDCLAHAALSLRKRVLQELSA
jgi:uncharacterized protein Yka (UPF0111/DUF47 family)